MTQNAVFTEEEERLLNLTQRSRETIIKALLTDNKLPSESSDKTMLMQALDGMDRSTLAKAKIKSDDKSNQERANAAATIADILSRMNMKSTRTRTIEEIIDVEIEKPILVIGETSVGADESLNYNSFIQVMKDKN